MRSVLFRGALCALVGLLGCSTTPPHDNPFDPGSPGTVQAKATLAGSLALESTGPGIFLSGIHVAVVGTGLAADTDAAGAYSISGVAPGTYTLLASKPGFEKVTIPAVTVTLADGEKTVTVAPATLKVARGSVIGKITLEGEISSAGVIVSLSGYEGAVQTGESGSFAFSNVPEGIYNLGASKVAFNPVTSPGLQVASGATTRAPDLTLTANPGSLAGIVTLQGATNSAGISVTVDGTTLGGNHHVGNGVTDNGGHFTLSPIPAGSYNVTFQATSYVSQSTAGSVSPGAATVIAALTLLHQTGSVQGTALLQGASDNSGIVISLVPAASPGAGPTATTLTDRGGSWRLDSVPVGTYAISYQKVPGYSAASGSATVVVQGIVTAAPVQLVAMPGLVEGTVALEGGGDPSALVTVMIEGSSTQAAPIQDGTYQLFPVGAGTQTVKFQAAGFDTVRIQVTLTPAEQLQLAAVTLVKSRGGVIGTLAVEGRANDASGILIVVHGTAFTAVTGPSGAFQIGGIPVGTYTLDLTLAGYAPLSIPAVVIAVGPPTPAPASTLSLLKTSQIAGTISLEGRSGAAGVTVHLFGTNLNGAAVSAPDALLTVSTSAYSFASLPAGSYTISASLGGYVTGTIPAAAVATGATLAEVSLQLSIARGLVQGAVTLPSGAPSSSGTLVQITQVAPGTASLTALTSASGAFSIAGVPAGNYTVSATHAGYGAYNSGSTNYQIAMGVTTPIPPVVLNYDKTASIAGTCQATGAPSQAGSNVALSGTDFNGNPVTGIAPTTTAADQSFIIASLPAGSFAVSCARPGFVSASAAPVALSAGEAATSVALSLAVATVPLNGQVTLSAGGLTGFTPEADLSGLAVTLSATVSTDLPKPLTAATAADGSFSFPAVPYSLSGAAYTLRTSRGGYLTASQSVSVVAPATPGAVALTLTVAQSNLNGLVTVPAPATDSSSVSVALTGTAFNGSAVSLTGTSTAAATSNYGFALAAGNYSLSFTRTGFATSTAALTVPIPQSSGPAPTLAGPVLTLARASGTVVGKVTVTDGGTSLAVDAGGVQIALAGGADLSATAYTAVTDSGGNFTIANVPVSLSGSAYSMSASKTGFTATGSATVTVAAAPAVSSPAGSLTLSLIAGSVSGVVSVPAPAVNSAGVTAALSGTAYNGAPWSNPSPIVSAASGSYTFAAVPPGNYTLQLSLAGYDAVSVTGITVAAAGAKTPPPQTLHRSTGSLYGKVTVGANGTGLALAAADAGGVAVTVSDASLSTTYSAVTDSTGAWAVSGVPVTLPAAAAYTVTATKPGYLQAGTTGSVAANVSSPAAAAIALSVAPSSLSGLVTVPAPAPDSTGVTVALSGTAFNGAAFAPANILSAGAAATNYRFAALPAGNYLVTFSRAGFAAVTAAATVPVPPQTGAAPGIAGPSVALSRASGTVVGSVAVSDGGLGLTVDASGILVALSGADLLGAKYQAVTDASGNFTIAGVPTPAVATTAYTVTASKTNFTASGTTTVVVAPAPAVSTPTTSLTMTVTPGSVSGVVTVPSAANSGGVAASLAGTAFNGAAFTTPQVLSTDGSGSTVNGGFSFPAVPPGLYTLTLTHAGDDALSTSGVKVSAGALTSLAAQTLSRSSGGLHGTVSMAANGTGLSLDAADTAGVSVTVSDASLPQTYTATTDATGSWFVGGIPVTLSGSYTVTAAKPGYRSATTTGTVAAGTSSATTSTPILNAAPSTVAGLLAVPAPAASPIGVSVSLSGTAFNGSAFGPVSVTSTAATAGTNYSFATLPAGSFTLNFSRAGYAVASAALTVPLPPATGAAPAIAGPSPTMVRATGTVAGKVTVTDGGTGLSINAGGVLIAITQPAGTDLGAGPYSAVTDSGGNFIIANLPVSLTSASYTVAASEAAFTASGTTTVIVAPAPAISTPVTTLSLSVSSGTVAGVVSVPAPAANSGGVSATLSGIAFNGSAWSSPASVLSQDGSAGSTNGAFTFASVPPGVFTLQLTRASYDPLSVASVTVAAGATTQVSTVGSPLILKRSSGTLYGTITLAANGTGLSLSAADAAGISLAVSGAGLASAFSVSTDASGSWIFPALPVPVAPATSYTLTISKPGYLTASGAVTPIAAVNTQVVAAALTSLLVAPSTLAGTVTAAPATSAAAVSVAVSGTAFNGTAFGPTSSVLTGAGASLGQYSIANLPAGNYQVSFSRAGYLSQSASVTVPVYASGSTPTIAGPSPALVRATGTVSGTVAAQDSAPATGLAADPGGAVVTLTQPAGADLSGGIFEATCDTSGNFTIAAVPVSPSGATYTVSVSKPNYSVIAGPTTVLAGAGVVTAPSGALTLAVNAGSVGGTVTVPAPAANSAGVSARLTGTAFNGAAWSNPTAVLSAANGSYSFPAVPAGSFTLQLSLAGYDVITIPGVKVLAGASTALAASTLLRSTGQLFGTVALSANGTGLALAAADLVGVSVTISDTSLSATYSASTDSAGNWSIAGVPVTLPAHPAYVVTAIKSGYWTASTTGTVVVGVASPAAAGMTLNVAPTTASGTVALVNPQPPGSNANVTASIAGIAFNGVSYAANAAPVAAPNTWSLPNVPAGNYTLTLTGSSTYVSVSKALVVAVPPGSPASAASLNAGALTLPRGIAAYAGTVQPGPNSTGLTLGSGACTSSPAADCANINVTVTDGNLAATFGAITDSNGRFSIPNVPLPADPTHGYSISASKSGFINSPESGSTVLAPAGTTLAAIALPANSSAVRGCVYVPSTTGGAPDSITSVTVVLSGTAFNGTAFQKFGSLAADTGNLCLVSGAAVYTFNGVADGSYSIAITRTAYFAPTAPTVTVTGASATASPLVTKMARATGAISGTVTVLPNGTGLTIGPSEQSGALVTISGADLPSALSTVTDGSGNFVLGNIPVNVTGGYTVVVSKSQFTAGPGGGVAVTLLANATTTVPGLTLAVTPVTLTVTAEIHDFINNGDPANITTPGINVSIIGTAFNGAPVSPSAQPTNASAQAVFSSLPSGTYAVSATYAAHTTGTAAGVTLQNGTAASVKVQLTDTIAPTVPSVAFANQSPTSATSTTLNLTVASTDATLPAQNLRDYQFRQCTDSICGAFSPWSGAALSVGLPAGSIVRCDVFAEDWNGNQSQIVSTAPILSIPSAPATPQNVRVDNRPGSVRISWDAATPSLSVAPVAGYKVYYGPIDSAQLADYNGNYAAQGISPITITGTELTLTSLPNASAFYVAVSAFDGVVDPKPNESFISPGVKANPNIAPLDRAAHLTTTTSPAAPTNALGMAAQRDRLYVSSGTAPGNYSIDSYQYDRYGTLTRLNKTAYLGSPARARVLVADANRVIYAFDPTATPASCAGSNNCGVDVIDVATGTPTLWFANDLANLAVDHLLPLHRGSANTSFLHGLVTYADGGGRKIATYRDFGDHVDINGLDANPAPLHTPSAPFDVISANQYAFTLHHLGGNISVDGYTIPDNFTAAISYTASVSVAYGPGNPAALALDWPNLYFTAGQTLYRTTISTGPLSFSSPVVQATIRTSARSITIAGDMLLVGEDPGAAVTSVEAFLIAGNGLSLAQSGSYELNDSQELPSQTSLLSMQTSGANLFLLMANAIGGTSLDVVEMGSPRYMARLGTANTGNLFGVSVAAKGSRALAVMTDGFGSFQLHDIDLHSTFSGGSPPVYTGSSTYASTGCSDPNISFLYCNPIAVWGDYAFVAREPAVNGPTVIAIYDVSTPAALTGAPIATVTASGYVTGLSAGSGFLVASVANAAHYVEWWDLTSITAPGPMQTLPSSSQAYGRSVDFYGHYAYVGTMTGFCIADIFTKGSQPSEIGCTTFTGPGGLAPVGARGIYADGDKVYTSAVKGSTAPPGQFFEFRQYDVSVPAAPVAFGAGFGTQTGGVPQGVLRTGPYLITSLNSSSAFDGLAGFTLSNSPAITPTLVGSISNFGRISDLGVALAGPFMLVPDNQNGLVMVRMY